MSLRAKYPADTADIDWISSLGAEGGWAVLSGDVRITRTHGERVAWRRTDLVGFFLERGWRKLTIREQAARLLLWWPKLEGQFSLVRGSALFGVPIRSSSKLRQLNF